MKKYIFVWVALLISITLHSLLADYPNITIVYPYNDIFNSSYTIDLNYTTNADSCWYSLDYGKTNYTLSGCANSSFSTTKEGLLYVTVWGNNSLNNVSKDFSAFFIDNSTPIIEDVVPDSTINKDVDINANIYDLTNTYSFVDWNNSLVFWLRMDDLNSSNSPTERVNGYNLSINGSPDRIKGEYGKAYDFNGNAYLTLNGASALDLAPNSFSFSVWVYPHTPSTGGWQAILEYSRARESWFGVWLSSSGNFHTRIGGSTHNSNTILLADRWYLLSFTYNSSTNNLTQYVNGKLDGSVILGSSSYWSGASSNKNLSIGIRDDLTSEYFNGSIDDILIFNKILSQDEISNLYKIKTLSNDTYYDKLYGSWIGQISGDMLIRFEEGTWISSVPDQTYEDNLYFNTTDTHIDGFCSPLDYQGCNVKSYSYDDSNIDILNMMILEDFGINPTYENIKSDWLSIINNGLYFANRWALNLMQGNWVPSNSTCSAQYTCDASGYTCPSGGCVPPYTGMKDYNPYHNYIDGQMEVEGTSMAIPGMPMIAANYSDKFNRVSNDGYALDFAKFFSMIESRAFFEDNITKIINESLQDFKKINASSRAVSIVEDVQNWSSYYSSWRDARAEIYQKYYVDEQTTYGSQPAYFIHSTSNFAVTIMSLLYASNEDVGVQYDNGLRISAVAGFDSDTNAQNVGAMLGTIAGKRRIEDKWIIPIRESITSSESNMNGLSYSNISQRYIPIGEKIINDNNGNIKDVGNLKLYAIPNHNKNIYYMGLKNLSIGKYNYTLYSVDEEGLLTSSFNSFKVSNPSSAGYNYEIIKDTKKINVSKKVCELTYDSAKKTSFKYEDINKIIKKGNFNLSWTDVRYYIDNWQKYCSDITNRTLEPSFVCEQVYFFLLNNNYEYNYKKFNNLLIKIHSKINISDKLLKEYIYNYDTFCFNEGIGDELPINLKKSSFAFFDLNITNCSENINPLMDISLPLPPLHISKLRCSIVNSLKYIFKLDKNDITENYSIIGIRIYFLVGLLILLIIIKIYKDNGRLNKLIEKKIK